MPFSRVRYARVEQELPACYADGGCCSFCILRDDVSATEDTNELR